MKSLGTNRCGQGETCGEERFVSLKQLNLMGILQLSDVNTLKKLYTNFSTFQNSKCRFICVPLLLIAPSVFAMRYLVKLSAGSKECA